MKRRSIASPAITIGCPAGGALPNEQCASDLYPSGRPTRFTSEFHSEWAAADASAR